MLLDALADVQEFSRSVFVSIDVAAFIHRNDSAKVELDAVLAAAREAGVKAGFDEAKIGPSLEIHLAEKIKAYPIRSAVRTKDINRKPSVNEKKLRALIDGRIRDLKARLGAIPGGLVKARVALEHGLARFPDPYPGSLSFFGPTEARAKWKSRILEMRRRLHKNDHGSPPSHLDTEHYGNLVRYYEEFEQVDGKDFVEEICRDSLGDSAYGETFVLSRSKARSFPGDLALILYKYWFYARSRHFRYQLTPIARRMIDAVASWQEPSGAWSEVCGVGREGQQKALLRPDSENTALAIHFLLRYGGAGEHQATIKRAKDWLLQNADKDGGWQGVDYRGPGFDVLTTIVVLDALRRAGAPLDHPSIDSGEKRLIKCQDVTGYWFLPGYWDEFGTCLAAEYLRAREERGELPNKYLTSAKALIEKAEELCLSRVILDARLAVIAAYHGLEHLLYGLILMSDEQAPIFRGNGDTCGFRDALGIFAEVAARLGIVGAGKKLPLDTQLRQIASTRDHIVHQAASVTLEEAEQYIGQVRTFVRVFDTRILGFPLLD
jgi:hypothetical protein